MVARWIRSRPRSNEPIGQRCVRRKISTTHKTQYISRDNKNRLSQSPISAIHMTASVSQKIILSDMRTEVYQSNQTSHPFRCRLLRGDQPSTSMSILQAGLGSSYSCAWVVNIRAEQPGLPKVDSTEMLLPDVPELEMSLSEAMKVDNFLPSRYDVLYLRSDRQTAENDG